MADGPIKPASPAEDTISQFREEGSIEWGEVSIPFKGVGQEVVCMSFSTSHPVQDTEADRPRGLLPQNLPVLAISSSRAIRSSIGGWVLKRERTPPPLRGLTINMWAVEGFASIGIR